MGQRTIASTLDQFVPAIVTLPQRRLSPTRRALALTAPGDTPSSAAISGPVAPAAQRAFSRLVSSGDHMSERRL
jgi:hypothetical protein